MHVDFFARREHYIDHMAPVWKALDPAARGCFYVPAAIADHARSQGVGVNPIVNAAPRSSNPMLVCAYGDLIAAQQVQANRKFIFMEHGVGITYGGHPAYAGGENGLRSKVSLFLAPNEIVRAKTEKALPGVGQVVVGTPKLDPHRPSGTSPKFEEHEFRGRKPAVAISFHWDGHGVMAEAGNAFEHFRRALPQLRACDSFSLIGHGHPRAIEQFIPFYNSLGIPVVREFDEIIRSADLYVCDNSSTIYEFLVTGKPVVLMNAPQYRRKVHWGIRFWDYTDVGLMVDRPEDLCVAILSTLANPGERKDEREKAIADLYPFLGESAERAARAIVEFLEN